MEIANYPQDKNLKNILSVLQKEFQIIDVYLFGSRAKGSASSSSDYDLFIVIKESNVTPHERAKKGRELLWNLPHSVDLFIYTQTEFEDWKNEFSSIPYIAFHEGLRLEFI